MVSEIAGTTRDVVETHLNIDGYPVIISDTAGIRDSKDEIEKKGIKLSLKKAKNADLKLVVVDAKNIDLSGFLNDLLKNNAILVVNKSDLLKEKLDPEISKLNHVLISLKNDENIDKLISKIKNDLKNKNILITGATGIIGGSIVNKLHNCNANILATGTKSEKLKILKSKYKEINIKQFDISEHSLIENFVNEVSVIFDGKIDILINNAGMMANREQGIATQTDKSLTPCAAPSGNHFGSYRITQNQGAITQAH